ncbi:hypothetical protein N7468_009298 [Penicillium chermesinum]|uniref:Uncharacterized protein n=1 Tax=Penicillium chermesinum TaxID=63820 RepID=A0A9W9NHF7_9EURO|nr:uncharacterized protein N7468_009298 [Penicillium chermesinum]KAJ5220094.1 hypothetical protein N7468_009298 [Penicillium chermesinum]KAJ6157543.1 hypothetical protein N7470_005135 [Penicillium chermesinum]
MSDTEYSSNITPAPALDLASLGAWSENALPGHLPDGSGTANAFLDIEPQPETLYGSNGGALEAMQNGPAPWSSEEANKSNSNS